MKIVLHYLHFELWVTGEVALALEFLKLKNFVFTYFGLHEERIFGQGMEA